MTRFDLEELLVSCKLPVDLISFEPEYRDGLCLRQKRFGWEVFVKNNSFEYDHTGFHTESDAMKYLYNKVTKLYIKN